MPDLNVSEDSPRSQSGASSAQDGPSAGLVGARQVKEGLHAWLKPIPRRILTFVLAVDAAWLLLYLLALATATHIPNLFFMMNLKAEGNPPTWWFGTQDMLVAITFLLLGSRLFASDPRVQPVRRLFLALGIGFACISADEVGQIHEKFAPMLEQSTAIKGGEEALMGALHVSHTLHGGGLWMVVYLIIGIALIVWGVPYLVKALKLWRKQLLIGLLGFGIFVFSAAILQVVGYFQAVGSAGFHIYVFVEQGLKMAGISVVFYGAMLILVECTDRLTRRLTGEDVTDPESKQA